MRLIMPLDPTNPLLAKLLGLQAPPPVNGPINPNPMPPAQSLMPSWMRTGLEGAADFGMGAIGVGPENKANLLGQLAMAGFPLFPKLGGLAKLGAAAKPISAEDEVSTLIKGMEDSLKMIPSAGQPKKKMLYDEAGRIIGVEPPPNTAYEAHVKSSVGKFDAKTGKRAVEPSESTVERMMSRYKK